MKTIKYLLIILFCSCATLLYSQVESTYYDAELSSDSIEMVANSLREQIDQWKQKVKERRKSMDAVCRETPVTKRNILIAFDETICYTCCWGRYTERV